MSSHISEQTIMIIKCKSALGDIYYLQNDIIFHMVD